MAHWNPDHHGALACCPPEGRRAQAAPLRLPLPSVCPPVRQWSRRTWRRPVPVRNGLLFDQCVERRWKTLHAMPLLPRKRRKLFQGDFLAQSGAFGPSLTLVQFPDVMFDALDELEQLIVAIPTDKDDAGFMTCKLAAMAKAERILAGTIPSIPTSFTLTMVWQTRISLGLPSMGEFGAKRTLRGRESSMKRRRTRNMIRWLSLVHL